MLLKLVFPVLMFILVGSQARAQLDNGIVATNLGKGDWIWQMSACETSLGVSTPQQVLSWEASKGMQWVTVKGSDGGDTNSWTQFNPTLITQAHALGLKIFAWGYVYGTNNNNLQGEINAALMLLSEGADGFIIDAESEYEGQPASATTYCQAIRAQFPHRFLAYAPFPYITFHSAYPYVQFGTYCDAVMPQDYWADIGHPVNQMVSDMDSQWRNWQNGLTGTARNAIKPIAPIGQGFATTGYNPGTDITQFMSLLNGDVNSATAGGYRGVSYWSCQHHVTADWNALAATSIGGTNPPPVVSNQYWDPDGSVSGDNSTTGAGLGGAGTWGVPNNNWWFGGSAESTWTNYNNAVFEGPIGGTVTLGASMTASSVNFNTTGYTLTAQTLDLENSAVMFVATNCTATIASTMAGSFGYTKSGPGKLILNNAANNTAGTLNITGGTLALPTYHPIGAGSGTIVISGGAMLENDDTVNTDLFMFTAYSTTLGSGGGTFNVSQASAILPYAGVISGSKLTKAGAGTLTLTGLNTFTGGLTLSSGTVSYNGESSSTSGAATATGAIPASATPAFLTLDGGNLQSTRVGVGVTYLASNKGITLTTNGGTMSVTDPTNTDLNIYAGIITGAGPLIVQGPGVLAVSGAETYTGATIITNGTLRVRTSSNRLPVTTALNITNSGILDLNGLNQSIGSLTGNGSITLGTGILTVGNDNTSPPTFNALGGTGVISGGGGLVKVGTGTLTLGGNRNTYTGTTTINNGLVSIGGDGATAGAAGNIGAVPTTAANNVILAGGTLSANNTFTLHANRGIQLTASSGLDVASARILTYGGIISATTTTAGLTKTSPGTLVLSGANTFGGGVGGDFTITGGTVDFNNNSSAGVGKIVVTPTGSAVTLATQVTTTLSNPIALNAGANTITLNAPSGSTLTLSGGLSGTNNLLLSGVGNGASTGIIALTGNSSGYSGAMQFNQGTLQVNNTTGSGAGSGAVQMLAGTLGGTGTVPGTTTFSSGAIIAPGMPNLPGSLTTGNETWTGATIFQFQINQAGGTAGHNPGWSQAKINGTLTFAQAPVCVIKLQSLTSGNVPGPLADFNSGNSYTWSLVTTTGGISGFNPSSFSILTNSFSNNLAGGTFTITTNATDLLLNFVSATVLTAPKFAGLSMSGSTMTFSGTGGVSGHTYYVLTSADPTLPANQWIPVATNILSANGNFTITVSNAVTTNAQQYFLLKGF